MTGKLRILHTEAATGWGGQQIRVLSESRGMIARGHTVTVACQPGTQIEERAAEWGVPIFTTAMKGAFDIVGIRALRSFMQEFRPHIINTHSSRDSWTGLIAARLAGGVTAVRTRHDHSPIKTSFDSRLLYCRLCDTVITTGEAIREYVIQQTGSAPERVVSIPTGIDTQQFSPSNADGAAFRRELGIPPDVPLVGAAAMFLARKGLSYFVDACAKVHARIPEARFVIVGDSHNESDAKERRQRQAEQLGISDKLILTGFRSDMPNVMAGLDVFVLASISEGLPQVVNQAMALKKPVVGTNVGGVPEQVIDGETGFLVEKANSDQIAGAVIKILGDTDLARRMGENGRRLVLERFSIEAMLDRTEALYDRLLGTPHPNGLCDAQA